jgi:predicted Na+-dependent transporter
MSPSLYLVASQAQEVALRAGRSHGFLRGALILVLLVVVVLVVVGVAIGVLVARRLGRRGTSNPGVDSTRWRR